MRERVGHGEVGRRSVGGESGAEWRVGRRRGRGPRPVRPGRPAVAVRPPEVPRPADRAARPVEEWRSAAGRRVLTRPSVRCGARYRLRRAVAGLALVVASAAAVVALGLLARAAEPEGVSAGRPASTVAGVRPAAPVVVTAESGETVWEVASRVAPELSGPQRAALAERIAADNALPSVRLRPGQVLRVAVG